MKSAIDWGGGVSDAWTLVITFVPRLVIFLIILLLGWLAARLLERLTAAVLRRVGFDRAVERGGIGPALARGPYDAGGLVAKLVFYAVILLALVLAFNVFGPNPVSDLLSSVVWFLPQLLVAILIVVVAAAIAAAVRDLVSGALGGLSYGRLLATLAWVFIVGIGIIAALNQVGIATTVTTPILIAVLATIAGILIVGVGGGLVRPMQQRWEGWLTQVEAETPRIQAQARRNSADVDEVVPARPARVAPEPPLSQPPPARPVEPTEVITTDPPPARPLDP